MNSENADSSTSEALSGVEYLHNLAAESGVSLTFGPALSEAERNIENEIMRPHLAADSTQYTETSRRFMSSVRGRVASPAVSSQSSSRFSRRHPAHMNSLVERARHTNIRANTAEETKNPVNMETEPDPDEVDLRDLPPLPDVSEVLVPPPTMGMHQLSNVMREYFFERNVLATPSEDENADDDRPGDIFVPSYANTGRNPNIGRRFNGGFVLRPGEPLDQEPFPPRPELIRDRVIANPHSAGNMLRDPDTGIALMPDPSLQAVRRQAVNACRSAMDDLVVYRNIDSAMPPLDRKEGEACPTVELLRALEKFVRDSQRVIVSQKEWTDNWTAILTSTIMSMPPEYVAIDSCAVCLTDEPLLRVGRDCSHMLCVNCTLTAFFTQSGGLTRSFAPCPMCRKSYHIENTFKLLQETASRVQAASSSASTPPQARQATSADAVSVAASASSAPARPCSKSRLLLGESAS